MVYFELKKTCLAPHTRLECFFRDGSVYFALEHVYHESQTLNFHPRGVWYAIAPVILEEAGEVLKTKYDLQKKNEWNKSWYFANFSFHQSW